MSRADLERAAKKTIGIVLAGGRGSRLHDLTDELSKPGLDFGGKYKIIDFALSNCVNSGIRRIGVLTQYNSHRLLEHLQNGWSFLPRRLGEFVHVWPADQGFGSSGWYTGTADAVYRNLRHLQELAPEHVLVLAGDHIYKMDYLTFLGDHIEQDADMSIACIEVPRASASGFGVVGIDANHRVVSFLEKPEEPPGIPGREHLTLASMGVYIFRASFLIEQLARDASITSSSHDFGHDLIPYLVPRARLFAHSFVKSCIKGPPGSEPYWRDVGTVDSYWEANLDLTYVEPSLNLYSEEWPIFTHRHELPPAKFVHDQPYRTGFAINSIVADGCIVSGAGVRSSVLYSKVRVHSHAELVESVILPGVDVGEHVQLRRAVVAPNVRLPKGLVVGEDPVADATRFHRTKSGVTLITQAMLDRLI